MQSLLFLFCRRFVVCSSENVIGRYVIEVGKRQYMLDGNSLKTALISRVDSLLNAEHFRYLRLI